MASRSIEQLAIGIFAVVLLLSVLTTLSNQPTFSIFINKGFVTLLSVLLVLAIVLKLVEFLRDLF